MKIYGVNELRTGQHEEGSKTIRKVLGFAEMIGVDVKENDISIAHRLPVRDQTKPNIVKFEIRDGKVNLMRKKRTKGYSA